VGDWRGLRGEISPFPPQSRPILLNCFVTKLALKVSSMVPLSKDNVPDNDNEFNAALEFTTMVQVNMLSFNLL
jgi:hypothetical protein